jgi:hypothetical protein
VDGYWPWEQRLSKPCKRRKWSNMHSCWCCVANWRFSGNILDSPDSIGQTPLFDLRAEINFSLKQIKVFMYFAGFCFKFAIYNICHDWWVQDVTRKASVSDTTSAGMHIGPFSPFTWFTESLLSGPVTIHNTFIDIFNGQQYWWGL